MVSRAVEHQEMKTAAADVTLLPHDELELALGDGVESVVRERLSA